MDSSFGPRIETNINTDTLRIEKKLSIPLVDKNFIDIIGPNSTGSIVFDYRLKQLLLFDGATWITPQSSGGTPGSGTVTSIGTGVGLTGGPITSAGTISLASIAGLSTSGTFTLPILSVDQYGRVTSIKNAGATLFPAPGTTGIGISSAGSNVFLTNSGVTSGTYSTPFFTFSVDQIGRITGITSTGVSTAVSFVGTTNGLTGGSTGVGYVGLARITGLTTATFTNPILTSNIFGQITGITSGPTLSVFGVTGNGISNSNGSIFLTNSGVSPGGITTPFLNLTINQFGQVTGFTTFGSTTAVTFIGSTNGLTGGSTGVGYIGLATIPGMSTGATFVNPILVTNSFGQITGITNGNTASSIGVTGSGISLANSNIFLTNSGVSPGGITTPFLNLTINQFGQVTGFTTFGSTTAVTFVGTTNGLTGGSTGVGYVGLATIAGMSTGATYVNPILVTNSFGQITSITNGNTASGLGVTGLGISAANNNIYLTNSGVSPGGFTTPFLNFTVNQFGQITGATTFGATTAVSFVGTTNGLTGGSTGVGYVGLATIAGMSTGATFVNPILVTNSFGQITSITSGPTTSGLGITGLGLTAENNYIYLTNSGISPGGFTTPFLNFTVNQFGQITGVSTFGSTTAVTFVGTTNGLTGGSTGVGYVGLADIAGMSTGATYVNPILVTNSFGQITSITSGPTLFVFGVTGSGISNSNGSIFLTNSGVSPGGITTPFLNLTINQFGQVTGFTTFGATTAVTFVGTTNGLTGGSTGVGYVGLAQITGLTNATFTNPILTSNIFGQITGITSGPTLSVFGITGLGISTANGNLFLTNSGVSPGGITTPFLNFSVNQFGQITGVSTFGSTTAVTFVGTTNGLTGGSTGVGYVGLATIAGMSTGATFTNPIIVTNSFGQITGITNSLSGAFTNIGILGNTYPVVLYGPSGAGSTYSLTFPNSPGTSGQVLTTTGGSSGTLSWVTPVAQTQSYSLIKDGDFNIKSGDTVILTPFNGTTLTFHTISGWNLATGIYTASNAVEYLSMTLDVSWLGNISNLGTRYLDIMWQQSGTLPVSVKQISTQADPNTAVDTDQSANINMRLSANDTAWIYAYQNSGVTLRIGGGHKTTISGYKILG